MPLNFTFIRAQVIFCFFWLVPTAMLQAQTMPAKPQFFHIHEAPVLPTMVDQYQRTSKELVSQCRKYSIQNGWLTIQDNDYRYYTIEPIEHMADLDKDPLARLQKTMGEEAYANLFANFDKCYPSHRDYILAYLPDYSYAPDQTSQSEYAYRGYDYFYLANSQADFKARDEANTEEFRAGFKNLFAEMKPFIRRIESRIGHLRPDLSYSPVN